MNQSKSASMLDARILVPAIGDAFRKLNPKSLAKNPVMFVVAVVSVLTTVLLLKDIATGAENVGFSLQIVLWLWFTVLFANFAEAVAEGRGKAQAESLRRTRSETQAKLLSNGGSDYKMVPGATLKVGDVVLTAKSSRASRRRTKRLSPANRPLSSASLVATAPPSLAARKCSPTGSRSGSRPRLARLSSTR